MANSCVGDAGRLGKALPQHKMMENLLRGSLGRRNGERITKGTQTDSKIVVNEMSCCCEVKKKEDRNCMQKKVKKLNDEMERRRMSQGYQNLLASIRERVAAKKEDEGDCCSCSDTWSDSSVGETATVHFPKETRNAMTLLISENRHRHLAPKPAPCAWPGVAERMDHDEERRLINADEIVAKITSKLSKNKLDIN